MLQLTSVLSLKVPLVNFFPAFAVYTYTHSAVGLPTEFGLGMELKLKTGSQMHWISITKVPQMDNFLRAV